MRAWLLVLACGCASTPATDPTDPAHDPQPRPRPAGHGGPSIQAEIGALDEDEARKTYQAARPAIDRCVADATKRYKFLEGEIEILLRVGGDGRVRWGYPKLSNLGDVEVERCIFSALEAQQWPKPQGGDEGQTSQYLAFDAAGRAASPLGPDDLGPARGELESALRRCRQRAGTSWLSVTFYVSPDGNVLTAGAAAGDEQGIEAIDCAVGAAKGMTFPTPGSYPAKVTLRVD
jgi:hypothetical protein